MKLLPCSCKFLGTSFLALRKGQPFLLWDVVEAFQQGGKEGTETLPLHMREQGLREVQETPKATQAESTSARTQTWSPEPKPTLCPLCGLAKDLPVVCALKSMTAAHRKLKRTVGFSTRPPPIASWMGDHQSLSSGFQGVPWIKRCSRGFSER